MVGEGVGEAMPLESSSRGGASCVVCGVRAQAFNTNARTMKIIAIRTNMGLGTDLLIIYSN